MAVAPVRDEKHWWLIVENRELSHSVGFYVTGRELLMNKSPEQLRELLGARFDEAAKKLREEFLKRA